MPENNENLNINPEPTDPANEPQKEEQQKEPSTQDLMNQIAVLKRSLDKATSEAAEYKRQYRATLSEQEKASQEKAEAQAAETERVKALERRVGISDFKDQYISLGYTPEDALKAATYQYDGDTESLFALQKGIREAHDSALRASIEKEIYAKIPDPKVGTGNGDEEDLFIKGFNSVKPPYRK